MKNIAIFCGANVGDSPIYRKAAIDLAHWLAQHNYGLVYGGGAVGLMGEVALTALKLRVPVTGIMPEFLKNQEISADNLDTFIITKDMDERKQKMMALSNGCIALPGGPGTLEEISQAYSWARVDQYDWPCAFYNVNGYYDLLEQFFDKMVEEGFLTKYDRRHLFFSDSLDDIYEFMENYEKF